MNEIEDNEIRIIGASDGGQRHRWPWYGWLAVGLVLAALVAVAVAVLLLQTPREAAVGAGATQSPSHSATQPFSHSATQPLAVFDTMINDVPLTIYSLDCELPTCPRASLQVGMPDREDTSLLLAVMAADVRADNGDIVGDFVVDGRQLARGEKKEGYCAILDGVPVVGRGSEADLKRAVDEKGCFFRQYVLVSEGVAMPPKPKGKNHRRALCVMGHRMFVVASGDRESYHDFATALADLGVDDAIALVGSESLLMYRAEGGLLHTIGTSFEGDNVNFLVWRRL
ncbi:MAG: phosphodiester glycosidase family protein [Bacteroidales bacterium]|nr:phosphodiester glycosidase family protein [Bacteroidales bacterium]